MNEIAEQTTSDLRQALQRHLAEDLAAVNEILRQQFRSSAPFVSDVLDHVAGYRGKQIRPLLLLLNCRMAGCIPTKTAQIEQASSCHEMQTLPHVEVCTNQ